MLDDILCDFANNQSLESMERLVSYFEQDDVAISDIKKLAETLASSGCRLPFKDHRADIASTGGPSSLSTLLCPLYLDVLGFDVVKLGIPGRPAGAIDALFQINNYKINYTLSNLEKEVATGGYIHFIADQSFTPLDAILYSYRKQNQKVDVPFLAIASLLSKKIAVGLSLVGLDIRVSKYANLGHNNIEASKYAKIFCETATNLGIKAVCYISDASTPYQPYIGRGESLLALYNIFLNESSPWLEHHKEYCKNISRNLVIYDTYSDSITDISNEDLHLAFKRNLAKQEGVYSKFVEYCDLIKCSHDIEIYAPTSGYCKYNLEKIRDLIVEIQNLEVASDNKYPDPCGLILQALPDIPVDKNQLIATLRLCPKYRDKYISIFNNTIATIMSHPPNIQYNNYEVVING
ncbi:hypothetical protein [Methanorbis rubei]|uniref:Thymidine phosphorylase n=1 Tax=Methanorbis rubei TaxID=3028300 RepID=A0AAE4MHW8_9EURY|nr:Thymidine phosphorylase [Methanocorpusculaceae archaeon Cs1]